MDEYGAEKREMGAGGAGSSPPRLPSIRPLSGFGETDHGHDDNRTARTEWTEAADIQPMEVSHDLTPPPSLFPVSTPSFPYDEESARCAYDLPEGFKPIPPVTTQQQQTVTSDRHGVNLAPVNPAFVADHRISVGIPNRQRSPSASAADDAVHRAHIRKHLDLLEPRIFNVKPRGRPMRTSSLTRRTHNSVPGSKGTKVLPLKASRAVPYQQAERELTRQRESLLDEIANSGKYPRGDASTALETARDGKIEIDPKKKLVFDSIGWTDRLGILDTVEMDTQYLELVVQEHVRPIEHIIYTTLIYREIHRYHIYPYIQPIVDPNPTVLATRHFFPDPSIPPSADGRPAYRVVYGDEAAEAILGRKLTKEDTEGRTYYERWIEGVDGIEYQWSGNESVEVGKRGWVERVGQTLDGDAADWYARFAGDREGAGEGLHNTGLQGGQVMASSSRQADVAEASQNDRTVGTSEERQTPLYGEQGNIIHGRAI